MRGPVVMSLALALCCGGLHDRTHAAEKQQVVSVNVPADFPRGLPVVLSGEWSGDAPAERMLRLQPPPDSDQPILGQLEAGSRRVWFVMSLPEPPAKQRVEFPATPQRAEATLRILESAEGFQFVDDGRPVLFYQRRPVTQHEHTRAGYVHPLRGLDGEVFTEVFPRDHRHHQGVFWAWHQLWVGQQQIGDPWVCRDHLVVVREAILEEGPVFATLDIRADWTSPLLEQPLVAERTRIRLFRACGAAQYVDFTIQLQALLPEVRLGGSEDVKGYSGFTVRVQPPADIRIKDVHGTRADDAIQTASPWADASGSFAEGRISGVAILNHPSLPGFPPRWVLRHYGMQNVAFPGREAIALPLDKPLTLRHRLVLHRGDAEEARVSAHQHVFEATP